MPPQSLVGAHQAWNRGRGSLLSQGPLQPGAGAFPRSPVHGNPHPGQPLLGPITWVSGIAGAS